MMRGSLRRIGVAAALWLAPLAALAQGTPVFQQGVINPGHIATFSDNGTVVDGATIGISRLDVYGPGTPSCVYDAWPTPAHSLCFGISSGGLATVKVDSVSYAFPGSGTGNILGPLSTTNNELAIWNGTGGTLLKDGSGVAVVHAGSFQATGATVLGNTLAVTGATTMTGSLLLRSGLTQNSNTATAPVLSAAGNIMTFGADGGPAGIVNLGIQTNGTFIGARQQGTGAAPTTVLQDQMIAVFGTAGHNGTGYVQGTGGMTVRACNTWSLTDNCTYITFDTLGSGTIGNAPKRMDVVQGITINDINGARPPGGDRGPGSLNTSSGIYVTGGGTPTLQATQLFLGGNATAVLPNANNEAGVFTSAVNGLSMIGQGSTNDYTLFSKAGLTVCSVATGLQVMNCNAFFSAGTVTAANAVLTAVSTGTPTASLCLDVSGNVIKKTTAGACI